jgi:hypothetical protein
MQATIRDRADRVRRKGTVPSEHSVQLLIGVVRDRRKVDMSDLSFQIAAFFLIPGAARGTAAPSGVPDA